MKKNPFYVSFLALFALFAGFFLSPVHANTVTSANTTISLVADHESIAPGQEFYLGVHFEMNDEWHIYYKDPGDSGLPPKITWQLPEGFAAGELIWPDYEVYEEAGLSTNVYHDELTLFAPVSVPDDVAVGENVTFNAEVNWLACKDICVPGKGTVSLTVPVFQSSKNSDIVIPAQAGISGDSRLRGNDEHFVHDDGGSTSLSILLALIFAFIGGLILNLMPCVLPVLSIKVLGLVKHADDPQAAWKNGLVFTLGVLVSFWFLAGLLLALRFAGQQIGWGFQFQSPLFLVFLSSLLYLFGLNLFGLFEVGTSLTALEGKVKKGDGLMASFMTGVLATAVATPCTAPFMGSALGFAIAQPPVVSLLVFTALGLGMAFPYFILAKFPTLLQFVPKPGAWMDTFKKALGFLLMLTVVWLLWVLGVQLGINAVTVMLAVFVVTAFAMWLYGMAANPVKPNKPLKLISLLIVIVSLVVGFVGVQQMPKSVASSSKTDSKLNWQPYSPALIESLTAEGTPIFLDFTAAWCLTCQVNERVALEQSSVMKAFDESGVVLVKADWTNYDPEITEALAAFGKNSIPLYVLYDREGETHILPEWITSQIVLEYLDKIDN